MNLHNSNLFNAKICFIFPLPVKILLGSEQIFYLAIVLKEHIPYEVKTKYVKKKKTMNLT